VHAETGNLPKHPVDKRRTGYEKGEFCQYERQQANLERLEGEKRGDADRCTVRDLWNDLGQVPFQLKKTDARTTKGGEIDRTPVHTLTQERGSESAVKN